MIWFKEEQWRKNVTGVVDEGRKRSLGKAINEKDDIILSDLKAREDLNFFGEEENRRRRLVSFMWRFSRFSVFVERRRKRW